MTRLFAAFVIIGAIWLAAEYWSLTAAVVILASMAAFGLYGFEERLVRLEQMNKVNPE